MYRSTPRIHRLVAPILIAVAIAGYLAGHRPSSATPLSPALYKTRVSYGTNLLLEHPANWRPASGAPSIPGLSISNALLLAPSTDAARAGLLSGQISSGSSSPLPAAFLAQLRSAPHTEVLDLIDAQAYLYSDMSIRGYQRTLDLYVIPSASGNPTALACYAPEASSPYLTQCRQIVATLTLSGSSPADLAPEAGYANRLNTLLSALDKQRLLLRAQMHANVTPATLNRLARALGDRFAATAASLGQLEAPPPASSAQAALTLSITQARNSYDTLATALANTPANAASAQAQVARAEAAVNTALASFALLGYSHA